MKILLGVPEYPPYNIWGWWEVFKNLAEWYLKMWHEVVVVYWYYKTNTWNEKLQEYYDENWIKYIQVPEIPYPKKLPFLRTVMPCNITSFLKLKKILKEEKIDSAHLHWYGHLFIDLLARLCVKYNIKYVFTNHWYPKIPFQKWFLVKIIWQTYMKLVWEFINRNANVITCVSEFTKSEYVNFNNKVHVVTNGVNLPPDYSNEELLTLRKNFPVDKKIILSVWRITEYKWFQFVVEQLDKIPDYIYLIIWEDQWYKDKIQELAKKHNVFDRIYFIWKIDNKFVNLYYKISDFVIIPSLVESFGLIWLEALINKKIVIHSWIQWLNYLDKSINAYNFRSSYKEIIKLLNSNLSYQEETFCDKYYRSNIINSYIWYLKNNN